MAGNVDNPMVNKRSVRRSAFVLIALVMSTALGSATAAADALEDYRWESRPLLLFAPTGSDPRLVETLSRIEASRCDFAGRDMVLGQLVTEGTSTLDGRVISADESRRLANQYAIGDKAFSVLLIGKDGGEKLRVNAVPDLQAIYALIDGMPMRSREATADPSQC
ncbi:MAG: DUF4174 domain-containing protein [Mycobacterium sp.]